MHSKLMILKELTYTIRNAIDDFLHAVGDFSGKLSDDYSWSKRYIGSELINVRSIVIRDALREARDISEDMVQNLRCVELIQVDPQECPCAPASGCFWLRTKEPVPRAIRYISVTDTLGKEQFTRKKWSDFKRVANSRIKSARTKRYYTLREANEAGENKHYLYIYAKEEDKLYLKSLTISGLFANPIKAAAFASCGEINLTAICNPMDIGFYTNEELRDVVNKQLILTLPQFRNLAPSDQLNNDRLERQGYERKV